MKMELIVNSETSAVRTQTPGNYPKRNKLLLIFILYSLNGEYFFPFYICINLFLLREATVVVVVVVVVVAIVVVVASFQLLN